MVAGRRSFYRLNLRKTDVSNSLSTFLNSDLLTDIGIESSSTAVWSFCQGERKMEERKQATSKPEPLEELFEPAIGDVSDELLEDLVPISSEKRRLVEKRRLAEQRLEERRLQDELGDYDLHLD